MKNTLINLLLTTVAKSAFTSLFKGAEDPLKQQSKYLMNLVKRNAHTKFGEKYSFSNVNSIEDYQRLIPVCNYDDLSPFVKSHTHGEGNGLIPGQPMYFATTSGSTGEPKFIPVSERAYKFEKKFTRASVYMIHKLQPESFSQKILQITSKAVEGHCENSISFGSATGQIEKSNPELIKEKYALHDSTFSIEDFEARYYCILRQAVEQNISMIITANPSTLVLLAHLMMKWEKELIEDVFRGTIQKKFQSEQTDEILKTLKPNPKLAHHLRAMIAQSEYKTLVPQMVWHDIKSITCWTGGNCAHYLSQLPELYGEHVSIKDPGYLASELRGTIPIELNTSTGLPTFNNNFFEFVEHDEIESEDRTFLTLDKIEHGKQYYIFITNDSGLYRYNINDIVEVDGTYQNVPLLKFIQKGKGISNLTGEKVYEQQVIRSVEKSASENNFELNFYILFANSRKNGYELYVQCESLNNDNVSMFEQLVDQELQNENIEYKLKRESLRLNPLKIIQLKERSFEIYKKYKVEFDGVRDAQFKMNYLTDNPSDIAALHSNIRPLHEDEENEEDEQII